MDWGWILKRNEYFSLCIKTPFKSPIVMQYAIAFLPRYRWKVRYAGRPAGGPTADLTKNEAALNKVAIPRASWLKGSGVM
jgi:hypothetical protein